MKKYLFASLLTLVFVAPVQAANINLEQLLDGIRADIAATRLSTPADNNALDKIQTFRKQAPYDYRVVPLVYKWGEAYVSLANNAIAQKDYAKAQGYLDVVWPVAALTTGLEAAQDIIDKNYKGQAKAVASAPSAADLERQRQVAAQAVAEKARVAAEQKRLQEEQLRQQEQAKKQAAEQQALRQQQEREHRLAAEQAAKAAAKPAPVAATPAVIAAAPVVKLSNKKVTNMWAQAEEKSAPIATYSLDAKYLATRDRDAMAKALVPICKAIVDNDASVVVHADDKAAYRWLTVRLTVCLRHEDKSFRLRHSYQDNAAEGEPYISLHPARDVSLIKQVYEG